MALTASPSSPPDGHVARPAAVLCGSFRRDGTALKRTLADLRQVTDVLSPGSIDFVGDWDGFVYTEGERSSSPRALEDAHLQALARADLVWLFAPLGYVGASATLELGHAIAAGVPVFGDTEPTDTVLRQYVTIVKDPRAAVNTAQASDAPASGLVILQRYYWRMAKLRGYTEESLQDTMLLLTEEIGELARAIRMVLNLARDGRPARYDAAAELADVQLYVLHLANLLEVDLALAVQDKERINDERFRQRLSATG